MQSRPPVWKMVYEAAENLPWPMTNADIRDHIIENYGEVNANTVNCVISVCSVNSQSRVHFPENQKPRRCTTQYDFLFKVGRGQVTRYDPKQHGNWEIRCDEYGKLIVAQSDADDVGDAEPPDDDRDADTGMLFALESHLRDFLAKNIETLKVEGGALKVYADAEARDGIEYPTDVGPIDILAVDAAGNFVVIELKVSRGADRVVGQAMRYMGWVTKHLAAGKKVSGVIVACEIDEKLKYAASVSPNITLFEYKLRFDLEQVALA